MIEFLKAGRRRTPRRSLSPERDAAQVVRAMTALCVVLALICLALAFAYREKARQVACYAEAAELSLAPQGDCKGGR